MNDLKRAIFRVVQFGGFWLVDHVTAGFDDPFDRVFVWLARSFE